MSARLCIGFAATWLVGLAGCSRTAIPAAAPMEREAETALMTHWEAIRRGDLGAAYGSLHPELKVRGLTRKRFGDLVARRRGAPGFPERIRIAGFDRTGDDVVVLYDLLANSPGGRGPAPLPLRRRARLRRSGSAWAVVTHDILAAGPGGG